MGDRVKSGPMGSLSTRMMALAGTLATVILGATMRGDWIIILVHLSKQFGWDLTLLTGRANYDLRVSSQIPDDKNGTAASQEVAEASKLAGVHWFILLSLAVSFASYHGLGGFLHRYYYVNRREKAEEWKCQPKKFLTPENERHEILLGSFNMAIGGTGSGIIACYIINGGYTTLYFSALERGWLYLILSTVGLFLTTDYIAYLLHRLFHRPFLYKLIHKMHHRYHQPTAWSATAMHPLEFIQYQLVLAIPAFLVPLYSGGFIGVLLYQYYYGMIDHSGIKMEALWPWQPPSTFHDNHHKYFHVNFGFNLRLWDKLHDTHRMDNRTYGEDIFYGRGKPKES